MSTSQRDTQADPYEEGIVEETKTDPSEEGTAGEIELLETHSSSVLLSGDEGRASNKEMLKNGHGFDVQVRWLKSGKVTYCRGPPFQDVTLAYDNGLLGDRVQALDLFRRIFQVCAALSLCFCKTAFLSIPLVSLFGLVG